MPVGERDAVCDLSDRPGGRDRAAQPADHLHADGVFLDVVINAALRPCGTTMVAARPPQRKRHSTP